VFPAYSFWEEGVDVGHMCVSSNPGRYSDVSIGMGMKQILICIVTNHNRYTAVTRRNPSRSLEMEYVMLPLFVVSSAMCMKKTSLLDFRENHVYEGPGKLFNDYEVHGAVEG